MLLRCSFIGPLMLTMVAGQLGASLFCLFLRMSVCQFKKNEEKNICLNDILLFVSNIWMCNPQHEDGGVCPDGERKWARGHFYFGLRLGFSMRKDDTFFTSKAARTRQTEGMGKSVCAHMCPQFKMHLFVTPKKKRFFFLWSPPSKREKRQGGNECHQTFLRVTPNARMQNPRFSFLDGENMRHAATFSLLRLPVVDVGDCLNPPKAAKIK